MRPQSIVQFERVYIAGIVVSLLASIWSSAHGSSFVPTGAPPAVLAMMPWVIAGGMLIGLAINLTLLFFIARKGSEVAKWIFIVFFAIGVAGLLRGLSRPVMLPMTIHILSVIQLAIQAIGIWLLFRPDARPWFQR